MPSVILIKLLCNFIEITLWHGCSLAYLLHISRTAFPKNNSGRLLLNNEIHVLCHVLNTSNIIFPISHLPRGLLEFSQQIS